ncbi:MAG: glycosyltransferase family 2 protein [Candidatus Saccharimonadales bacterium]
MLLAFEIFALISILELLLWTRPAWKARRWASPLLAVVLGATSVALVITDPSVWTIVIAILSAYRCANLARIAAGRIQVDFLFHASRRTSLWIIGVQLAIAGLAELSRYYDIDALTWWTLAADVTLLCAAALLLATLRHLRTTRPPKLTQAFTKSELPALTVAIPARNETGDLEECLQSLLASTYPKLEIVVLDDCSQDKRTPEIIRGFAHAGVRFIAGKQPPASWLAKNYAYDQLAEAANGDLLLFCGVDVRFQPGSLDAMVGSLLQKHKAMVSVLPRDETPRSRNLPAWFMQPSRYAWELTLPRRLLKRPPVLSTCWMITRQALENAGGFDAVRRKGVPESYLARATANSGDGYSFLQADAAMDIASRKAPAEQRATAVRTRYLQLHRRPEMTALIALAEAGILVMPPILAVAASLAGWWTVAVLSAASFILNAIVYASVFDLAYRRFSIKGIWLLPVAAAYDIGLLNYSMWKYEFGEVLWKGRNVCIPVMRVTPKLPQA